MNGDYDLSNSLGEMLGWDIKTKGYSLVPVVDVIHGRIEKLVLGYHKGPYPHNIDEVHLRVGVIYDTVDEFVADLAKHKDDVPYPMDLIFGGKVYDNSTADFLAEGNEVYNYRIILKSVYGTRNALFMTSYKPRPEDRSNVDRKDIQKFNTDTEAFEYAIKTFMGDSVRVNFTHKYR